MSYVTIRLLIAGVVDKNEGDNFCSNFKLQIDLTCDHIKTYCKGKNKQKQPKVILNGVNCCFHVTTHIHK